MRIALPALAALLLAAACHPHAEGIATTHAARPADSITLDGVTMSSVASPARPAPGERPTGAAAGTAISAFVHPGTLRLIDPSDRPYLERAVIRAHNARPGTRVEWQNPGTGNGGAVVPRAAERIPEGMSGSLCLGMDHALEARGISHAAYVDACRHSDGTWVGVQS